MGPWAGVAGHTGVGRGPSRRGETRLSTCLTITKDGRLTVSATGPALAGGGSSTPLEGTPPRGAGCRSGCPWRRCGLGGYRGSPSGRSCQQFRRSSDRVRLCSRSFVRAFESSHGRLGGSCRGEISAPWNCPGGRRTRGRCPSRFVTERRHDLGLNSVSIHGPYVRRRRSMDRRIPLRPPVRVRFVRMVHGRPLPRPRGEEAWFSWRGSTASTAFVAVRTNEPGTGRGGRPPPGGYASRLGISGITRLRRFDRLVWRTVMAWGSQDVWTPTLWIARPRARRTR